MSSTARSTADASSSVDTAADAASGDHRNRWSPEHERLDGRADLGSDRAAVGVACAWSTTAEVPLVVSGVQQCCGHRRAVSSAQQHTRCGTHQVVDEGLSGSPFGADEEQRRQVVGGAHRCQLASRAPCCGQLDRELRVRLGELGHGDDSSPAPRHRGASR
jgi:hypothetical protein